MSLKRHQTICGIHSRCSIRSVLCQSFMSTEEKQGGLWAMASYQTQDSTTGSLFKERASLCKKFWDIKCSVLHEFLRLGRADRYLVNAQCQDLVWVHWLVTLSSCHARSPKKLSQKPIGLEKKWKSLIARILRGDGKSQIGSQDRIFSVIATEKDAAFLLMICRD